MPSKCDLSICLYGLSGVGKTTQIEELLRWCWHRYGQDKILRLVTASGGRWASIRGIVDAGYVQAYDLTGSPNLLETIEFATQGYWPDESGRMQPPDKQLDWNRVAGLVFESIKEIGDLAMDYCLRQEAAKKIQISAMEPVSIYSDGSVSYASPSMAHYGSIQRLLIHWITQSKSIPGRVIMWTSLEGRGSDEMQVSKLAQVYGPDAPGVKLVAFIPPMFEICARLAVNKQGTRLLHSRNHMEGTCPNPFLANARCHWRHPVPSPLVGADASIYKLIELVQKSHELGKQDLKKGD